VNRLTRISRLGGAPMGWGMGAACAAWPTRSAIRYTGPWNANTRNPVLIINNRLDPNSPLANAQRVVRLLRNAVLLVHDGYGHLSGADPSACVTRATGRYLVGLRTPPRGTVCPSDRVPACHLAVSAFRRHGNGRRSSPVVCRTAGRQKRIVLLRRRRHVDCLQRHCCIQPSR
jgi:hypothetical protein